MAEIVTNETRLFELAFDLAYFIHANREIAFFIAEDALEGLTSVLGFQRKHRAPSEGLRGFWKWGERTRPLRKTLILDEYQMLQWLVYKHSEYWERQTEEGSGFYSPSEEDLTIRYIEHLVYLNVRRGSFYTTLAICSLLYQLDRRETRVFYDVLTQSDPARIKDANYIGKQRLELIDRIHGRFAGRVESGNKSRSERQVEMQSPNQLTTNLVKDSLRRFTPWGTDCVVLRGFDVTDIPELYFSGTALNEEGENLIEMNRLHCVLHPECLDNFMRELAKYVGSLPDNDLDSNCNFESLDERLVVPRFINLQGGPPRGNRFESPKLRAEDYVRLRRMMDARGQRKKVFVPQTLSVYVDGVSSYSFEPTNGNGHCTIPEGASFLEVRGRDDTGEVLLAALFLGATQTASAEFEDSIVHSGGQKVSIKLKTPPGKNEDISRIHVEITYTQNTKRVGNLSEKLALHVKRIFTESSVTPGSQARVLRFAGLGVLAVTRFVASMFAFHISRKQTIGPKPDQTLAIPQIQPVEEVKPTHVMQEPIQTAPSFKDANLRVGQARWSTDRRAALRAVSVELTRAEQHQLDFSGPQSTLLLSFPLYDPSGQAYARYKVVVSEKERIWDKILVAPKTSLTQYANVLELTLLTDRLPQNDSYRLSVQGFAEGRWQHIGNLILNRTNRREDD